MIQTGVSGTQIATSNVTERLRVLFVATLSVLSLSFLVSSSVLAYTSISESYTTASELSIGSLVSLKEGASDEVVASLNSNVDNLLGVVINEGSSLLSIRSGQGDQVQVATGGTLPVLVSDINGPIEKGDQITASPISGVGMRATGNIRVIGVAQTGLTNAKDQTYKDSDGKQQSIKIGQIPAQINVSYFFKQPDKTIIPASIQSVANSLAGRKVSPTPIIISGIIFIVMLVVVTILIYSMIRSSIISVGRNPMSQSAIYRDLIQLSMLVLGILTVGVVAIYLVLTRL